MIFDVSPDYSGWHWSLNQMLMNVESVLRDAQTPADIRKHVLEAHKWLIRLKIAEDKRELAYTKADLAKTIAELNGGQS